MCHQAGKYDDAVVRYDAALQLAGLIIQRAKYSEYAPYMKRLSTVR